MKNRQNQNQKSRQDKGKGVQANQSGICMSNQSKKSKTPLSADTAPVRRKGPVVTSTKQMAGYFTVSGIENQISLTEKDWPCFALKEL